MSESKGGHAPTREQAGAIVHSEKMQSFKIAAYAGGGKTSTLAKISRHLYDKFGHKGLYLAFNKSIADEAREKLHSSVDCRTFHSLAYKNAGKALTSKINYKKSYPMDLVEQFNPVDVMLPVDEEAFDKYIKFNKNHSNKDKKSHKKEGFHNFSAEMQMQAVNNSISAFCGSIDKEITMEHIRLPDWVTKDESTLTSVKKTLLKWTVERWNDLIDTSNTVGITHDVYLKVWAMTEPTIEVDYILFDESQDADNVQLFVLGKQKCPVIYVGDRHQGIYEWRGAVNAMEKLDIPELRLTKSFRFGTEVAMYANKFLSLLGEPVPLIGHAPLKSKVYTHPSDFVPDAILCRTNKGAFGELIDAVRRNDGRKYAIQANIEEIISFLVNAKKLINHEETDHVELDNFSSWEVVEEYAELNPTDQNVSGLVRIIKEFEDINLLIKTLKDSADIKDADCIICTSHKSKGLEWDNVKISSDFNLSLYEKSELEENLNRLTLMFDESDDLEVVMKELKNCITKMTDGELRLLYVAVTRAKKSIDVSNIKDFFETYDYGLSYFYNSLNQRDLNIELG